MTTPIHHVYIEQDVKNVYIVLCFKNQSIAECVWEAAIKWGRHSFVLSYIPQ